MRGTTGLVLQIELVFGIVTSQFLGFRQIFGTDELWHYILAFPFITSTIGFLGLLLFFPETPRVLLVRNQDEKSATRGNQINSKLILKENNLINKKII